MFQGAFHDGQWNTGGVSRSTSSARTVTADWSIAIGRSISKAVNDPGFLQVIGAHFHLHSIADSNFNEVLSQFTGNMCQDLVAVRQLDPEHSAGQDGGDFALDLNCVFVGHRIT